MRKASIYLIIATLIIACNNKSNNTSTGQVENTTQEIVNTPQDIQNTHPEAEAMAEIDRIVGLVYQKTDSLFNYDHFYSKTLDITDSRGDSIKCTTFFDSSQKLNGRDLKVRSLFYKSGKDLSPIFHPQISKYGSPIRINREVFYDNEGSIVYAKDIITEHFEDETHSGVYQINNYYYFRGDSIFAWRKKESQPDQEYYLETDWQYDTELGEFGENKHEDIAYPYAQSLILLNTPESFSFKSSVIQELAEMRLQDCFSSFLYFKGYKNVDTYFVNNGITDYRHLVCIADSDRYHYRLTLEKHDEYNLYNIEEFTTMDKLPNVNTSAEGYWLFLQDVMRHNDDQTLSEFIHPEYGLTIEINGGHSEKSQQEIKWSTIPKPFVGDWEMDRSLDREGIATLQTAIPGEYMTFTLKRINGKSYLISINGSSH